MSRRVVASAPGKLILMGEHAAVYGQPALVAAVDPRSWVEANRAMDGLKVDLADLDQTIETSWQEAQRHAELCREAWLLYAAEPSPERFAEVGTGSASDLALVALGELAMRVGPEALRPLSIRIESGLPMGSGFGSSASIAVALVGSVLKVLLGEADPQDVDVLAFEVERRQHGLPSGVDHRTVLHGGVVVARRQDNGSLRVEKLGTRSGALHSLDVHQTGQPAETTGEVVAAVRRRHDRDPGAVGSLLERMGSAVLELRDQLVSPEGNRRKIVELFGSYERYLEELGVVPMDVRLAIRQVEEGGGAAKISGAGALTGAAAGCLLAYWPDDTPRERPVKLRTYPRQEVELGTEGLRIEECA